jgi:3-hydroxy-3-methylglutaryl CoA synthase/uncharacterized OB-fold protein
VSRPSGIVAYGAYVPYYRLDRAAIGQALGSGGGRGTRAVASYDEDTTSMGVEAARAAMRGRANVDMVYFATAAPAYLDKTNATAIHAALDLDASVFAADMSGSVRSGVGALRAALDAAAAGRRALAIVSDVRTGLPGSADERDGGDGAAAFIFGAGDDVVADFVAAGSATAEVLDRWRLPGDRSSKIWEERFGEHVYLPLAEAATADACKAAGIVPDEIHHVVVTGTHARAVSRAAQAIGVRPESVAPPLDATIGNAGTAALGLALANVLNAAAPDELVLAVNLADGADAFVLRTTPALAARAREPIAGEGRSVPYATFLTWRGMLEREPPRRPDPERPAAPPSFRREDWKFAFVGSRCTACGTRHLPPQRVCVRCHAVDQMARERLADVPGAIVTYTIDRLAFSLSPPVVVGVIDFDGGGRFQCELTDVDPDAVDIGDRVQMTFRRLFTAAGVHDYFWKAKPI